MAAKKVEVATLYAPKGCAKSTNGEHRAITTNVKNQDYFRRLLETASGGKGRAPITTKVACALCKEEFLPTRFEIIK